MKKMTYQVLAICIAILFIKNLSAQNITLEDVSSRSFSGVHVMEGKGYYTFYFGEKTETKGMANFVLELFDLNLNHTKTVTIEMTKFSELSGSAFSDNTFLFSFADQMKKTATWVTIDENGNTIDKKVEEDIKMSLLSPDNYPTIYPIGNGEFVVIKPIKEKKIGYNLERIDAHFNAKYETSYSPEKGSFKVLDSEVKDNKIFVLKEFKPSILTRDFENKIICYDLATGTETYSYNLFDGQDSGFPFILKAGDNGTVTTSGMFFKGDKFDGKNSDGIFYLTLDAEGKEQAYGKTSWKFVQDLIKGDFSSALIGGKTKVLVEDIITHDDGTYSILGETFRKSENPNMVGNNLMKASLGMGSNTAGTSGNQDVDGFTIMDFVLFNYNKAGVLTGLDKIEKPTKDLIIKGEVANWNALSVALFLKKADIFTYQYQVKTASQQYVVYINYDGVKEMAYFLPTNAKTVDGIQSIDMNKGISESLNKFAKFDQALNGKAITYDTGTFGYINDNPNKYRGITPAKEGYMLMYKYFNQKLNIWLEPVPSI